jgi:transcriptional regulator of acetoin/glycerol metabolism
LSRNCSSGKGGTLTGQPGRFAFADGSAVSLDEAERAIILQVVEQCQWRIRGLNGAAALLDIKPTTLESRIKKLGLVPSR